MLTIFLVELTTLFSLLKLWFQKYLTCLSIKLRVKALSLTKSSKKRSLFLQHSLLMPWNRILEALLGQISVYFCIYPYEDFCSRDVVRFYLVKVANKIIWQQNNKLSMETFKKYVTCIMAFFTSSALSRFVSFTRSFTLR